MGRTAKPKDNESLTKLGIFQQIDITQLEYNDGQLQGCPKNPRYIKENEYASLKKSLLSSPEFLEYKPLMVYEYADGKYITICGNMRLKAANELLAGGNEQFSALPCFVLNAETSIAKIKEYAIKDNVQAGSWDWDDLANDDWNVDELQEWGVDCNFLQNEVLQDPLEGVGDLNESTYEEPKKNFLECPYCHHRDSSNHFKKVECLESEVNENEREEPDDEDVVYEDIP